MDDYRYQALRTLTRSRFDIIQNLTREKREKQRFANYLFLKCSGIAQEKDIQNTSATTIALMEQFETVDDLANADLDELTFFIDEKGRNFADPAAKAKAIRSAARDSRCHCQSSTGCGQRLLPSAQDSERHREPGHVCIYRLHAGTEGTGQSAGQGH